MCARTSSGAVFGRRQQAWRQLARQQQTALAAARQPEELRIEISCQVSDFNGLLFSQSVQNWLQGVRNSLRTDNRQM
jgi:hypothetical protein